MNVSRRRRNENLQRHAPLKAPPAWTAGNQKNRAFENNKQLRIGWITSREQNRVRLRDMKIADFPGISRIRQAQGVHVVRKGNCVLQPAKIRHREIEHSEDFEVLEIVAPGDFKTHVPESTESTSGTAG